MADIAALEAAYKVIVNALSPWAVFGSLDSDPEKNLKLRFRQLSRFVHPDQFQNDQKAFYMANEAMAELNSLYDLAKRQVLDGTYGPAASVSRTSNRRKVVSEIVFGEKTYRLFEEVIEGDFCQVFSAEMVDKSGAGESVVLKIPIDRADNDLLDRESDFLRAIQHKSLPVLVDTFKLSDGRKANVLRNIAGGEDLVTVRNMFPSGLPVEHVVWIMDRLLSVLGYIHINQAIHGLIEPANIMVVPANHNGLLIDFTFSILNATQHSAHYTGANDFTAPEVLANKHLKPYPTSDMYSLGLSMLYLLGGDTERILFPSTLDIRVKSFVGEFLVKDPQLRANDAWAYHKKLRALRIDMFGAANQFLNLNLKK